MQAAAKQTFAGKGDSMNVKGHIIQKILPGSIAEELEIKPGDRLLAINNEEISDIFDYQYYVENEYIEILIEKNGGEQWLLEVDKDEDEDLGIVFENGLMDDYRSCHNKCIFCFIDQMPKGMRETLYFKDDDARLSFLQGNYVTLTNLNQEDIDRIIQMKLNINVSVHTTNPDLRCKMMNNRFAGEKLDYLRQFAEAGIAMNCQIVLCPGINDGSELERTLNDLGDLMPNIQSIAVVPVGITKFREGLFPIEKFDKESASRTLDIIEKFQKKFLEKYDTRVVFPADEFYITAERNIPEGKCYEDYCQYENGVGMLRSLADEFDAALEDGEQPDENRVVSIATGEASYKFIKELVEKAENKWHNIKCNVYCIKNHFFGETITVTGLLTAQDIISQLKDKELGNTLLLSNSMFKSNTDIFLDDLTISDVEKSLGVKIAVTENDGYDLLDKMLYD